MRLAPLASRANDRALGMKLSVLDPEALDALIRRFMPVAPLEVG
jgi:hypothetical protein